MEIILSLVAVLALHCRFEVFVGSFQDSALLNGLHKLYGTFSGPDYTDLLVFAAIYIMLRVVRRRDEKIDSGFLLLSLALSVILVVSISFKKFDSADFLFANAYQWMVSCFCIIGICIVLYGSLRCIYYLFSRSPAAEEGTEKTGILSFLNRHFFQAGFWIIFLGWLPWIVMNYPGSECPDSILQFKEFFGEENWAVGHPPLSTAIMGILFSLGRMLVDANFGFFLYCFMQTCAGALIFSLSMKKLRDLGIPFKYCMVGIAWFAFTPLWGTYAQWVEKDLFYTEIALLQTVCMLEILIRMKCGRRDAVFLACSSLGAVFLRNNGIYAVLPALVFLAVRFRGITRKRVAAVSLIVLLTYEGVTRGLYPALGVEGASVVEPLSIPFQQTARYVCEYPDEITEHEREVLERTFFYDALFSYNPVLSDPIKNHCRGVGMGEYFGIWFRMFFKHPGTYLAAFINKCYGYLAPVSQNIEAWIQLEYYDYMKNLGISHVFPMNVSNILVLVWNMSMTLPLVKYLCTPGIYTWIVVILTMFLIRHRKYRALILFVPAYMNILVCLASPMADAIRYELPTVACVPLLTGWAYFSLHSGKEDGVADA
ncbi:MAG TPA: hypothetical protein DCZ91_20360 [Lachnospiraceae bacterium]|nr:hypothetical protein [Lachnospiraceae bacterium]